MKKTLSINLGGYVYHIDEDAYQMLMDYLHEVKLHLSPASSEEVLNDIEQRMSELINQWMQQKREVIVVSDVEKIIEILGRPEQYQNDDDQKEEANEQEKSEAGKSRSGERNPNQARRIYRDTKNAFLGGVCAGLAAYFNVSIVLVRILMALSVWFYGLGLLIYLLAWMAIPEAKTAAQRLEMRGEDVTIENIEKKVKEEADRIKKKVDGYVESGKFDNHVRHAESGFLQFIKVVLKVILAIIGGVLGLVGFFVLMILIFALIAAWSGPTALLQPWPEPFEPLQQFIQNPTSLTWFVLGMVMVIGIPFAGLIRLFLGVIMNFKPVKPLEIWISVLFWFIGFAICVYSGIQLCTYYSCYWM